MDALLETKSLVLTRINSNSQEYIFLDESWLNRDDLIWPDESFCGTCRKPLSRFEIRNGFDGRRLPESFVIHCSRCGLRATLSKNQAYALKNHYSRRGICPICFGDEKIAITLDLGNGAKKPHTIPCPSCTK